MSSVDVELLRPPGLVGERELELSGAWFTELCFWLGCRVGELGSIGWPMVLIPEIVDRRFGLSEQALQVYQRVVWRAELPRKPFKVEARVGWVSSREGSVEVGLASRAGELAEGLLVARTKGEAETWGERDLPARPDLGSLRRRRTLVVDEAQVRIFAELAGTKYPINDDVRYAQQMGYPNVLVQGLVLFITQLHLAKAGGTGQLEMWFRRAVPAASLLELCQSDDPAVWAFRLVGSGEVAAVARQFPAKAVAPD